jgi:hypothetical protein
VATVAEFVTTRPVMVVGTVSIRDLLGRAVRVA